VGFGAFYVNLSSGTDGQLYRDYHVTVSSAKIRYVPKKPSITGKSAYLLEYYTYWQIAWSISD
jgi:hypothetical protein